MRAILDTASLLEVRVHLAGAMLCKVLQKDPSSEWLPTHAGLGTCLRGYPTG